MRLQGIRRVFADSILPVEHAGQLVTWADFYDLGALRLRPAGDHTPGSSVVWLDDGPAAMFAGDLLHTPLQILRPDDVCAFDLDPAQATAARRRDAERLGKRLRLHIVRARRRLTSSEHPAASALRAVPAPRSGPAHAATPSRSCLATM